MILSFVRLISLTTMAMFTMYSLKYRSMRTGFMETVSTIVYIMLIVSLAAIINAIAQSLS